MEEPSEEETLEGALTAESALPFLMEGLTKPVEDEEAWTALLAWYLSDEGEREKVIDFLMRRLAPADDTRQQRTVESFI